MQGLAFCLGLWIELGFWDECFTLGLGLGLGLGFGLRVLGLRFRVRVRLGFWCRV